MPDSPAGGGNPRCFAGQFAADCQIYPEAGAPDPVGELRESRAQVDRAPGGDP